MKKSLMVLLTSVLLIVACLLMSPAAFADSVASGTCGSALTWTLDSDGLLTISGSGEMQDFEYYSTVCWREYKDSICSVNITDGVTSIGGSAFSGCSGLTSVTIPSSVTSIGSSAFYGCRGIKSAGPIGSGANYEFVWTKSIPSNAFSGCSGLTSVTIPSSVTSIGDYAFYGCSGLTSVTIPSSVMSIGNSAFYNCIGLTSVTIPSSVTSIGNRAFSECSSLTNVTIPSSVTSIGNSAFSSCSALTDVYYEGSQEEWDVILIGIDNTPLYSSTIHFAPLVLPDPDLILPASLKTIEEEAFSGGAFVYAKLPEGTESIQARAFADCPNLKFIYIPESTTVIHRTAFENVSNLTILGQKGSYAGYFANSFGYNFIETE